jgi:tetratricopeptide (TPR) repeat protein
MEKLKIRIEEAQESVSKLENFAYYILLGVAFLLPLFFIPSLSFPFQFSKSVFVSITAVIAFALWIIARLKDGRFMVPNNKVFIASLLVVVASLVATLLSPVVRVSFIGQGFELGTWSSFFIMFLVMFLFAALFRPKERVFYLYLSLFSSFFIIIFFHTLRFIFGADFLSFGIFTDITSNLIGKWNDLGIFFSLVTVLSMVTLELLSLNRLFKFLVFGVYVVSLLSLMIVNFPTVWYALLASGIIFIVYSFAFRKDFALKAAPMDKEMAVSGENQIAQPAQKVRSVSYFALILIVVSLLFIIDYYREGRPIGTSIATKFNVSHLEVRPNWVSTLSVAKEVIKKDPVFGAGNNRFSNEWLLNKPAIINETLFWNTDFNFGIGFLPTLLVTTGVVGALSWVLLFIALIITGIKAILSPVVDKPSRYLLVSSFFASVFLWVFFIFYIPSTVITTLTFLFTGVFIASLYNDKVYKAKTISFAEEPKISFISVLVLTVLLVGNVTLGYIFVQKFVASAYFQKALIAANNEGNLEKADTNARKAAKMSKNDTYDLFVSEVSLAKINNLLTTAGANANADQVRSQFQTYLGDALTYARAAVEYDSTNYKNWVGQGRVYEAVVPLRIEGAYENAVLSYDNANKLNPSSPRLDLDRARLETAKGDNDKAKQYIEAALAKKSNYTEAIFLKSQIQANEGDLEEAISSVESASLFAPNDPTVFFQLGILRYNDRQYRKAVEALERAVFLAPSYANAKYFLGLSYDRIGEEAKALVQFRDILTLNPGNAEVTSIIANIEAGRDPFYQSPAPSPESRDTLPIEENTPTDEE